MADPQPPPPQRFRWDWGEFAFATMTNVAGALVTTAVIYLGGWSAATGRPTRSRCSRRRRCSWFPRSVRGSD